MLVDKDVKNRQNEIFINGFHDDQLGCISYDIKIGKILKDGSESSLLLAPGDFVMVQSEEEFSVPKDLAVLIGEKNSLMRTGLIINGPTYFPGHHTKAYLRVINASDKQIEISKGQKIAQMFFVELSQVPERPYQTDQKSSFSDETEYMGFGRYSSDYQNKIRDIESATDKLKNQEGKMYSNILGLMAIFVSIFSLLTIDFTAISQNMNIQNLVIINCSLALILIVFIALIYLITNLDWTKKQRKWIMISLIFGAVILFAILIGLLNI